MPVRLALAILAAGLLAAQQPTIRVPVRLVSLSTLVVSKDSHLVSDLQARDFRVLDNGRPQAIRVEESVAPLSIVVAVQTNLDVRSYVPFIAGTGSAIESLLAGEGGEVAVVTYGDEVRVVKPFESGDAQAALRSIGVAGRDFRLLDAAGAAVSLLSKRPRPRSRILLFIGQPADSGSESDLDTIRRSVEREDVAVHAMALPMAGRAFVSDTFSLNGVSRGEKGGIRAGADAKKLAEVLSRSAAASAGADPFTVLAAATGGAQFHFRSRTQLEGAVAALGTQLHSGYVLSFYPSSTESGYHAVAVEVNVPGAKVYARPGYWLN